ncbi:MAG: hypothetical protein Q4D96_08360, partial [Propionibacteriaceae bacterium]|nr:hypothetical protein [Propionibacteriaceae bacterium]
MKGERDKTEFDEFFFSGGKMIPERVRVSVNRWVPELTASVCAACNNGWMSQLEGSVRRFLGGYVLDSREVMLSGYECLKLAQWSVK